MLIITSVFPHKTQSLAGGVFNTISQVGNAVGLAIGGVIAASVATSQENVETSTSSLLAGYDATFWACLGTSAFVGLVSILGLRKAGKVGLKND